MLYAPPYFKEERPDVLRAAIQNIALATLVTQGPDGILANHLPLLLDGDVLSGHFARANPVWKSAKPEALAIFMGPQFYVSPNSYPTKHETGKAVPTWNYITVHARGVLTLHQDPEWLRAHVTRLSDSHEMGRPNPWKVSDAPQSYIDGLLRAIVGFELKITSLEGKWKLSQNRPAADIEGVKQALERDGHDDLAALMKS